MLGFIFSIIAGGMMSLQGVFNTRLSDEIGLYESNAYVQGTAFLLSIVLMLTAGNGGMEGFTKVPMAYKLGGAIGVIITVTVMLGIKHLTPTIAISTILIAQLLVAAAIDAFGWFGQEKLALHWTHYAGTALMICGVVLFKWEIK